MLFSELHLVCCLIRLLSAVLELPKLRHFFLTTRLKLGLVFQDWLVLQDRIWCVTIGSDTSMRCVAQVIAEFMDPIILVSS
jgi:hypothetical protein